MVCLLNGLDVLVVCWCDQAFQEQITYPQVEGSGDFTLCYDVSGESDVTFPGMVVHMTGADLETQGSNLFENVGSETYCLFMGTMGGSGIPGNIIGNRQQRDNIVVYDEVNQQVGFQATDCSQLSS